MRILAIDEVNFTEVGTASKQKRFLNALRYLANELESRSSALAPRK
jgi:hypothetical protein